MLKVNRCILKKNIQIKIFKNKKKTFNLIQCLFSRNFTREYPKVTQHFKNVLNVLNLHNISRIHLNYSLT